jgi:hypothetical protein
MKYCETGKACGNSCIAKTKTCWLDTKLKKKMSKNKLNNKKSKNKLNNKKSKNTLNNKKSKNTLNNKKSKNTLNNKKSKNTLNNKKSKNTLNNKNKYINYESNMNDNSDICITNFDCDTGEQCYGGICSDYESAHPWKYGLKY